MSIRLKFRKFILLLVLGNLVTLFGHVVNVLCTELNSDHVYGDVAK